MLRFPTRAQNLNVVVKKSDLSRRAKRKQNLPERMNIPDVLFLFLERH